MCPGIPEPEKFPPESIFSHTRLSNHELQVLNGMPNFDQFIEFVLFDRHAKENDPHLEFFWRKCDMCNIHYDVIGKKETSAEDMKYIEYKVQYIVQWYTIITSAQWEKR